MELKTPGEQARPSDQRSEINVSLSYPCYTGAIVFKFHTFLENDQKSSTEESGALTDGPAPAAAAACGLAKLQVVPVTEWPLRWDL